MGCHEERLELEIQPPFIPTVKNPRSAENFDPAFTNAKINLTPSDVTIINNLRGDEFQGFTYVNPTFASIVLPEKDSLNEEGSETEKSDPFLPPTH